MAMNCENEKVYSLKRETIALDRAQSQTTNENGSIKPYVDISHQLRLNSAVVMKNRKSTASYNYRNCLIELEVANVRRSASNDE